MKPPKSWLTDYAAKKFYNDNDKNGVNHDGSRNCCSGSSNRNRKNFGSTTDDTFRNYMARKINLQRRQFGLVLPPRTSIESNALCSRTREAQTDPATSERLSPVDEVTNVEASLCDAYESPENSLLENHAAAVLTTPKSTKMKTVRFDEETLTCKGSPNSSDALDLNSGIQGLVSRLKRKHGSRNGFKAKQLNRSQQKMKERHRRKKIIREKRDMDGVTTEGMLAGTGVVIPLPTNMDKSQLQVNHSSDVTTNLGHTTAGNMNLPAECDHHEPQQQISTSIHQTPLSNHVTKRRRPDLFFLGVTVLVNGYTEPSTEIIMRTLHKYGGDLEKYETSRVTHIIAQNLSSAKANIYKKQKRPIPVVKPQWITDSVEARKLLPHGPYLLDEVKDKFFIGHNIVESYLQRNTSGKLNQNGLQKHQQSSPSKLTTHCETHKKDVLCDVEIIEEGKLLTQKKDDIQRSAVSVMNCSGSDIQGEKMLEKVSTLSLPDIYQSVPDRHDYKISSLLSSNNDCKRNNQTGSTMPLNDENIEVEEPYELRSRSNCKAAASCGGQVRTVGTDPDFLESYFRSSRLSFIGSFKQRMKRKEVFGKHREKKKNDQKYVFHVDMDCFFAAVALRNFPQYKNQPVAISHAWKNDLKGIVHSNTNFSNHSTAQNKRSSSELSTCNYIARKHGIKKGMFLHNARILCPDLIVLPYDYEGYEEVGCCVVEILHQCAEFYNGVVEQVSCDEAYIEIHLDEDTSVYNNVGHFKNNENNEERSHCDLVNAIGKGIRADIFKSTQCTASVGIGANKLIAKLATDSVKPDGLCFFKDWKECLMDTKLRDLPGIGYQMEKKLVSCGLNHVRDIWDMGKGAETELRAILGPANGKKVYKYCYGEDQRPVQPIPRKTIGAECNYGVRFNGPYGVDHMMSGLAKEVVRRMEDVGVVGNHITLKIKERKKGSGPPGKFNGMGSCNNHSKSCNLPITNSGIRDPTLISRVGMELFNNIGIDKNEVRGMGIVISKLNSVDSMSPEVTDMSLWIGPGKKSLGSSSKCKPLHVTNYRKGDVANASLEKTHIPFSSSNKDIVDHDDISCSASYRAATTSQNTHVMEVRNEECVDADQYFNDSGKNTLDTLDTLDSEDSQDGRNRSTLRITANNQDTLKDIMIPSYSQIDMDEVMALPESFRDMILKTLRKGQDKPKIVDIDESNNSLITTRNKIVAVNTNLDDEVHPNKNRVAQKTLCDKAEKQEPKILKKKRTVRYFQQKGDHFLQPDVKRVLKLASIKAGTDKLVYNGEEVSRTQLDCLPLDVQLQVANNDDISSIWHNKSQLPTHQISTTYLDVHKKPTNNASNDTESSDLCDSSNQKKIEEISLKNDYPIICDDYMDSCDQINSKCGNDCIVIRDWLDSLENATGNEIAKFQEYLRICVSEKRLDDVVKYLQIIKRRDDIWGKNYVHILKSIDNYLFSFEGRRLDLCWLGLT